mgnify:CR=1 FL=1
MFQRFEISFHSGETYRSSFTVSDAETIPWLAHALVSACSIPRIIWQNGNTSAGHHGFFGAKAAYVANLTMRRRPSVGPTPNIPHDDGIFRQLRGENKYFVFEHSKGGKSRFELCNSPLNEQLSSFNPRHNANVSSASEQM